MMFMFIRIFFRYGLAMMVEMFTAILSGADYASKIPPWRKGRGRAANLGKTSRTTMSNVIIYSYSLF